MKRPGQCRNPGCERLATISAIAFGLGDRDFCYHCFQALTSMGMAIRRKDQPQVKPKFFGGAA